MILELRRLLSSQGDGIDQTTSLGASQPSLLITVQLGTLSCMSGRTMQSKGDTAGDFVKNFNPHVCALPKLS